MSFLLFLIVLSLTAFTNPHAETQFRRPEQLLRRWGFRPCCQRRWWPGGYFLGNYISSKNPCYLFNFITKSFTIWICRECDNVSTRRNVILNLFIKILGVFHLINWILLRESDISFRWNMIILKIERRCSFTDFICETTPLSIFNNKLKFNIQFGQIIDYTFITSNWDYSNSN